LKKKEREQAMEKRAKELEGRVSELERECEALRRENGWLKGLVVGVTGAVPAPESASQLTGNRSFIPPSRKARVADQLDSIRSQARSGGINPTSDHYLQLSMLIVSSRRRMENAAEVCTEHPSLWDSIPSLIFV